MQFLQFEVGIIKVSEITQELNVPNLYDWRKSEKAKEVLNRMLQKRKTWRSLSEGV